MSNAHSKELRQRVIQIYHEEDCTIEEVARRFKVGKGTITRWLARFCDIGSYDAMAHNGGLAHQKLRIEHRKALVQWLEAHHGKRYRRLFLCCWGYYPQLVLIAR